MDSENKSPFLRLPKEIRLIIYDLLFPPKVIHISGRVDHDAVFRRLEGVNRAKYIKVCHTLCFDPKAEDEAHTLSRLPDVTLEERQECHDRADRQLRSYYNRHKRCLDLLSDFEDNSFLYSVPNLKCDDDCRTFRSRGRRCQHYAKLVKEFGEPSKGGLRKIHPETDLDLSFLLVCRQVYCEASLLPYSSNTFTFSDLDVVRKFAEGLSREQVAAVSSIQLSYWTVGMVQEAKKTLTGLKTISLDHSHTHSPEKATDRKAYLGYSLSCSAGLATTAKVIWSRSQKDKEGWNGHDVEREDRRRDAEAVERAMTRKA